MRKVRVLSAAGWIAVCTACGGATVPLPTAASRSPGADPGGAVDVDADADADADAPRRGGPAAYLAGFFAAPSPSQARIGGKPAWRGAYCSKSSDCEWNDPCAPRACIRATGRPAPTRICRKVLSPGTCSCVEHQCTLKPKAAFAWQTSAPGCLRDSQCAVDVPTATCHLKGRTSIGPIRTQGPFCACNRRTRRCEFRWAGPVRCKSWRDCWYELTPRIRPVKAKRRRRRQIRPCRDAPRDSRCVKGVCRVVAWSC